MTTDTLMCVSRAHQRGKIHAFCPVRLSTTAAIVLVIDIGKGRMRVGEQGVEQVAAALSTNGGPTFATSTV